MKIVDIIVGIVVVSGLITGMGVAVSDIGSQYGKTDQFNYAAFNETGGVNSQTSNLIGKLNATTSQTFNPLQVFDILNFLFFLVTPIFFTIPNFIFDIIHQASLATGGLIPDWLIGLAITATIVVIAVKVFSFATRRSV